MYSVRGRSAAYDATVGPKVGAFVLWNGHASQIARLVYIITSTGDNTGASNCRCAYSFVSARGTPASTVTPNISNDSRRGVAPPSGLVLDLGPYSAEPTFDSPEFWVPGPTSSIAPGGMQVQCDFNGVYIPPGIGFGLEIITPDLMSALEITAIWRE